MTQSDQTKDAYFAVGDIVEKHFSGYAFKATHEGIQKMEMKPMEDVPINIIRRIDGITIAKTEDNNTDIVVIQDVEDIMETDKEIKTFNYDDRLILSSIEENPRKKVTIMTNRIVEFYEITPEMYVVVEEFMKAYPVVQMKRV